MADNSNEIDSTQKDDKKSGGQEEASSLFILKNTADSLLQPEAYLKNRGWKVGSSSSLRDAIAYIISSKPEYLLLSADHPQKKVKMLPKLLAQAFPITVISFTEKSAATSIAALHEMGLEYSLFPPISGPAIQRIIFKIKKDTQTKEQEAQQEANSQVAKERIKNKLAVQANESESSQLAMIREALSQIADSDEVEDNSNLGFNPDLAYDPTKTQEGQISNLDLGETSILKGTGSASSIKRQMLLMEGESPMEFAFRMRELGAQNPGLVPPQGEKESNKLYTDRVQDSLALEGITAEGPKSPFMEAEAEKSDWTGFDPRYSGTEENQVPEINFKQGKNIVTPDKSVKRVRDTEFSRSGKEDSLIVKGAKESLDKTVVAGKVDQVEEVEEASNVACIQVSSPRFSGYLVCAMGKNRKIDENFLRSVQKKLFQFLKDNGEKISEKESLSIKIEPVEFQDWAIEQAEFLKKAVHEGNEIAMAFFPTQSTEPKLEASEQEHMLKMSLEDFKADATLEFDLYIYMPENQKYILYTPTGMKFYGAQKDRLADKGVKHMHMRKESEHNVKRYKAQVFLNEKIATYKSNRKKA